MESERDGRLLTGSRKSALPSCMDSLAFSELVILLKHYAMRGSTRATTYSTILSGALRFSPRLGLSDFANADIVCDL